MKNLFLRRFFESRPYLLAFQKSIPLSLRSEEQNSPPIVLQAVLRSRVLGNWAGNRGNSSFERKTRPLVESLLREHSCVRLSRSPLQPARTSLLEIRLEFLAHPDAKFSWREPVKRDQRKLLLKLAHAYSGSHYHYHAKKPGDSMRNSWFRKQWSW